MISVGVHFDPRYTEWKETFLQTADLLRDLGIDLREDEADGVDLNIVHSTLYATALERKEPAFRGPVVVWERADQETVTPANRRLIARPEVVGWLKDHLIRDASLHNAAHVDGYWHYGLLPHDRARFPSVVPPPVAPTDLRKIGILNDVAAHRRFAPLRAMPPLKPDERPIDVCFIGTTVYRHEVLHDHRQACFRAMGGLGEFRVVSATGYALSSATYQELIRTAKIFVSPYGYSMSSWKDWEAIYSGCVLIKPDPFQQLNYRPDLFAERTNYAVCEADFSDLRERVAEILCDYSNHFDRTAEARETLLECRDKAVRAYDAYRYLLACLERTPTVDFAPFSSRLEVSARFSSDVGPVAGTSGAAQADFATPRSTVPARVSKIGGHGRNRFPGGADLGLPPWTVVRAYADGPRHSTTAGPVYKLTEDGSSGTHDVRCLLAPDACPRTLTFGLFAAKAERSSLHAWLGTRGLANRTSCVFNLDRGVITAAHSTSAEWPSVRRGIERLDDQWWWCWISAVLPAQVTGEILLGVGGPHDQIDYSGDGVSGLWLGATHLGYALRRPKVVSP